MPDLNNLLARFETGDVPSQADFNALITTLYAMAQDAKDAADAAAADVATLTTTFAAKTAKVFGKFSMSFDGNAVTTIKAVGCTIAKTANSEATVTFTTAFPANTYVLLTQYTALSSSSVVITAVRNTGTAVFTFAASGNRAGTVDFAIFYA